MISIDSLGIDFFFNGFDNVEKAEKAKEVVNGLLAGLGKLVGAAGGVYKVGDAIRDFIVKASNLKDISEATGEAVENLDVWSRAVKTVGGDADTFLGTVKRMSSALHDSLMEGGPMLTYFSELGISVRDSNGNLRQTTDILHDLAGKWESWSPAQRHHIGVKLGLDDGTIKLLQRGQKEVERIVNLQAKYNIVSGEQAQLAREISELWNELTTMWAAASDVLTSKAMPAVKAVLTVLRDISSWVIENKPILYGLITGIAAVLGYLLLPVLIKVAVAWVAAFAPVIGAILLIAALSAAIYALIDDYMAWKNGGESVLGEVWAQWDRIALGIGDALGKLKDFLVAFWNEPKKTWDETLKYFEDRWKGMTLEDIAYDIMFSAYKAFESVWKDYITPFLLAIDSTIKKYFGFSLIEEGDKLLKSFYDGVLRIWDQLIAPFFLGVDEKLKGFFGFSFIDEGKKVLRSFWDGIKLVWEELKAWFNKVFNDIDLYKMASDMFDKFIQGIKDKIPSLSGVWNSVKSAVGLGDDTPEIPKGAVIPPGMSPRNLPGMGFVPYPPPQSPFNVPAPLGAGGWGALNGNAQPNNNLNNTTYVNGITISVPSGDPKTIASGMNNAIKQNPPGAWNYDGPIRR